MDAVHSMIIFWMHKILAFNICKKKHLWNNISHNAMLLAFHFQPDLVILLSFIKTSYCKIRFTIRYKDKVAIKWKQSKMWDKVSILKEQNWKYDI